MQHMSTVMTWQTDSTSSSATSALAEALGRNCRGGEIFELISDLGGGKTTFVQGLAKGLDSPDQVNSPTFMIERVYKGRLELHHFDFYRLGEAGLVGQELAEVIDDTTVVTAIEWGEVVHDVLPSERVNIKLERTGDESRHIKIEYPVSLQYLMDGIV
jgi:tRNA threonylcarbamoyladenosine biosynthesis protein TsaE